MKDFVINEQIRSVTVMLVLANGEAKGQFTKSAAIQMARNEGMDLVQVSPGNPPVCRIADYGKMRYKASTSEKKQKPPSLKEIRFGIDIAKHDLDVKLRKIDEVIAKGHRVVLTAELSGRQKYTQTHKEMAREMVKEIITSRAAKTHASDLKEAANGVSVTLSPN